MRRCQTHHQQGAVVVAVVVVLVLVFLVVVGAVITGGRSQDLTVRQLETIDAFYAAEAGMNMAVREMVEGSDEDGDGEVGTISDDGNAANDPTVGAAQVLVTSSVAGSITTLTSQGRRGTARRQIEATAE